jgi:Tfp pilus assembly protein FimV
MVTVAAIVTGLGAFALSREGVPSDASASISVRVSPSDTLWSIAAANRLPGATTAATVDAIARVNGLHDSRIVSGATLKVPTATALGTAFAQADEAAAAH